MSRKFFILLSIAAGLFVTSAFGQFDDAPYVVRFPYREYAGKFYDIRHHRQWTALPPVDGGPWVWRAKVASVEKYGVYVTLFANVWDGKANGERDWQRTVFVKNCPRTVAPGDNFPRDSFYFVGKVGEIQVYDYGKPYDPQKKAAELDKQTNSVNTVTNK